jgi:crotonobetainyl-CoA:carnitine CoA-transferase CaiB-like acyl-CoA transferase
VPIVAIDMSTALYSFGAISAALFARVASGRGRHIEASLLQAAAGVQGIRAASYHLDGGKVRPVSPPSGIWQTRDGWFSVTVVRPWEWTGFCTAISRPDLGGDARYRLTAGRIEHAAALRAILTEVFAGMTNAELGARCAAERIMHEEVNSYSGFLTHEHTRATGAIGWVDHPHIEGKLPLPNVIGAPPFAEGDRAPSLGADTRAVLRAHGLGEAEIDALVAQGAAVAA